MSDQVTLPGATSREQRRLVHYLDEGARGPTFVDRSAIHELLAEDPAERELRAPFLEPVISSPPEGEELIHRYCVQDRKPPIYVGETWVKKVPVADKDEHKATVSTLAYLVHIPSAILNGSHSVFYLLV